MPGKPVRIAVVYQPGEKIRPIWFELNRKQHRVAKTTYFWKDRMGDTPLLHFAVIDENEALFELVLNTHDQSWMLYPHQTE
jgi:hypothetical protein